MVFQYSTVRQMVPVSRYSPGGKKGIGAQTRIVLSKNMAPCITTLHALAHVPISTAPGGKR